MHDGTAGAPRRIAIAALVLLATGCASAEEIQAEFAAHVEESNACVEDAECALISPGCPLGCFVSVRADAADACAAYAAQLIDEYERSGARCDYDCIAPGPVRCEEGRCTADPIE